MRTRSWYQELLDQVLYIWHFLIPEPQDRIPVTTHTILNVLFPLLPLLFMGYLVRRPDTHVYRLALMPFTIWTILRASFGYVWVNEEFSPYNFGQGELQTEDFVLSCGRCSWLEAFIGLFGIASVGKAIEYGFVKEGRFKNGEGSLGQVTMPAIDRVTANQPSGASTLGITTPSSHTPMTEGSLKVPESNIIKSPSGVTLAYISPNKGHSPPSRRKPVKSPSGVALGFKDSSSSSRSNSPAPGYTNGYSHPDYDMKQQPSSPLQGLADAIEVLGSVRGIGWDWGKGLYMAPETRPLDRRGFIKANIQTFLLTFLALDLIESTLKITVPPFRTPRGGSIFFMTSPPAFLDHTFLSPIIKAHPTVSAFIAKYTVSTGISFFIGLAIIAGFEMCYSMLTLFCVGLLGHNTESWPPIFDHPWRATSLADFWGKRWHQTLRQTFFIFGGYPLQFVVQHILRPILGHKKAASLGRVGLVLGTFIASGLFHGLSIYGMGEGGVDHAATLYFTGQGLLLLVERAWRMATGKRVSGIWGRLWTYAVVIFGIEFCMDGWSRRGLASGLIIPPFFSPTRLILFPIIIRLMK